MKNKIMVNLTVKIKTGCLINCTMYKKIGIVDLKIFVMQPITTMQLFYLQRNKCAI